MMKKIIGLITVCMLAFVIVQAAVEEPTRKVAVLPFYDESGYHGPYELRWGIPIMLGDMLGGDGISVVPMDTIRSIMNREGKMPFWKKIINVFRNEKAKTRSMTNSQILAVAKQAGADYAIIGTVSDFVFGRTGLGEPFIGGYKKYKSSVAVENIRVFNVRSGKIIATVAGEHEKDSGGLGLELLGKPRDMDMEFYSLDSLEFGSKRFISTMLGQTTIEALNIAQKDIRNSILKPGDDFFADQKYTVIDIESPGIVLINAGSDDAISAGDRFSVYAPESGIFLGHINVIQVWGPHISRAEIISGQDAIRPDDVIRPYR